MKKCPNCSAETGELSTSCGVCGYTLIPEPLYTIEPEPEDTTAKAAQPVTIENKDPVQTSEHTSIESASAPTPATNAVTVPLPQNSQPESTEKTTFSTTQEEPVLQEAFPSEPITTNNTNETENEAETVTAPAEEAAAESTPKKAAAPTSALPLLKMIKGSNPDYLRHKPTEANNTKASAKAKELEWIETEEEIETPTSSTFENLKAVIIRPVVRAIYRFFFKTKDETDTLAEEDIKENCTFAIFSYLAYLFFIPMIAKPYSRYLRFHGNQGLTLFLTTLIMESVNVILNFVFGKIFIHEGALTGLGVFLTVLVTIFINGCILLWVAVGIYNAVKGNARELPLIGRFRLLK